MEVRFFTEEDIVRNEVAIKNLMKENYLLNHANVQFEAEYIDQKFDQLKQYFADKTAILIGVFKGEILAGFLWAYRREVIKQQRIHITSIIVESKSRSSGYGKELMFKLEEYAKEQGIFTIDLLADATNDRLFSFYKNNGYEPERIVFRKDLID